MYRSPREAHEARIYTGAYRVYGMIHLVPGAGTADLLNQERPYLPVTGALVYAPGFRHPRRPGSSRRASTSSPCARSGSSGWPGEGPPSPERARPSWRGGASPSSSGTTSWRGAPPAAGVRLSDFLSQAKPFQTLKEAGLHLLAPDRPLVDPDPLERFPFLTVNLRLAEGVVEAPGEASDPRLTLFG